MISIGKHPIGICSWSLKNDFPVISELMQSAGMRHIHLAVSALDGADGKNFRDAVNRNGWTISSMMVGFPQEDYSSLDRIRATGGIIPDDCWSRNRELALKAVNVTAGLGVKYLSMHAGFIDHTDETGYRKFCDRMRMLADCAGARDVTVLMETGQEMAEDLRRCLEDLDHSAVGVNFDPANMILYDKGDPIAAIKILAPWVKHVHIKDARKTKTTGEWGAEVPWGDGEVGAGGFINALDEEGFDGALAIEREAGDDRVADIKLALSRLVNPGE